MSGLGKATFVIVASGRGSRFGGEVPKQYVKIRNVPVLAYSLRTALGHPLIGDVAVVIHTSDHARFEEVVTEMTLDDADRSRIIATEGGDQRQNSVLNGLEALVARGARLSNPVLVHDAARPFLSESLVTRAIACAMDHAAGIPVLPVTDTVKRVAADGIVSETLDRNTLRTVQTPQAFTLGPLLDAHRKAAQQGLGSFPDDASLMEWAGASVATFEGETSAFKVTHADDIDAARAYLDRMRPRSTRVATGYDVHALGEGDHVWLGGLKIEHNRGLIGHSDADPVLHALTDAVMGTLSDGDIGSHFPPSDPKWKGAASHIFLRHAIDLLAARGGRLVHLDATIICEEPKIGPHRSAMRAIIAGIVGADIADISVKATTSEQLGFTGRREGIAAIGTATVTI